MLIGQILVT